MPDKFIYLFKTFSQYCKLFRLPNLLMIALTQYLVRFYILKPLYQTEGVLLQVGNLQFALLVLSTVVIAAAGYLINDYYDQKIDTINKPNKVYVGRVIHMNKAYTMFFVLSALGCLLGIFVAWSIGFLNLGMLFIVCATVLYYYSLRYKRLLLWGTLSVSVIVAFYSIVNVWLFEFFALRSNPIALGSVFASSLIKYINWVILAYALFAFLLSFIREIIKDNEDSEGDKEESCKSLILVYGPRKTKIIVSSITLFTIILIGIAEVIIYNSQTIYFVFSTIILLQIPLFVFLSRLNKAQSKEDYHILSNLLKFVTLAGILSIVGIPQII